MSGSSSSQKTLCQSNSRTFLEQTVQERIRSLRGLIKDIEHFRQKARPPIGVNVKGAKSQVAGKLEDRKTNYALYDGAKTSEKEEKLQEDIRKKCDRYYKSLRELIREHRKEQLMRAKKHRSSKERCAEKCAQLLKQVNKAELVVEKKLKDECRATGHINEGERKVINHRNAESNTIEVDINSVNETLRNSRENALTQLPGNNNQKTKKRGRKGHVKYTQDTLSNPRSLWSQPYKSPPVQKSKYDMCLKDIQVAIKEGKSQDPLTNKKLAYCIKVALNENIPWSLVEKTISEANKPKRGEKMVHLLQIQVGTRIYVMATVRTSDFPSILAQIDPYMHQCNAQFVPVLQHFTHCCCIEAIMPKTEKYADPTKLQKRLINDAMNFKVERIEVINFETGEVYVKCDMQSMTLVSKAMEERGYTVLASDYGFKPKAYINLGRKNAANYRYFLHQLQEIPDIESICDNVL